jgi:tRNA modification GTPase
MNDPEDTICALSTPAGRSGIAVVRISGIQSFALLHRIFLTNSHFEELPFRHAMLGSIKDPSNDHVIDEAIAICFPSPHSYTGEDMVELSLHGSPVLITALLDCLRTLGARLAEPGEFTLRAFLHGRIDLTQAEAVNDIINATTLFQAQVAEKQRSGALAQQMKPLKEMLIHVTVNLESAVEFAEEDLALDSRESLMRQLEYARHQLHDWIGSYRQGRIIREGFSMAIIGRPNVGKSSVFNALLAQNRSIVTEIPGTTRDLVSEFTNLGGIPVRLLDTAGIQSSVDHIERLGIDRSFQAMADADATLFVVDATLSPSQEDLALRQRLLGFSCIVAINKVDLGVRWSAEEKREFTGGWPHVEVSAKTGFGIGELRTAIMSKVLGEEGIQQESVFVTNLRHLHKLQAAERDLEHAAAALKEGLSEEFALIDIRSSLQNLGTITGETNTEDLLTEIFSRFCIGK